jgi:hypothetical protein
LKLSKIRENTLVESPGKLVRIRHLEARLTKGFVVEED